MGNGVVKECPKCGHKEFIFFGLGFGYPGECEQNMDEALKGNLGPEIERLVREEPKAKVEAEFFLYRCPDCKDWVNESSHDVFYPKEEYKNDPNIKPWDNEKYFLKHENKKFCFKCNKQMKKYKSIGNLKFKCPECGECLIPSLEDVLWD